MWFHEFLRGIKVYVDDLIAEIWEKRRDLDELMHLSMSIGDDNIPNAAL